MCSPYLVTGIIALGMIQIIKIEMKEKGGKSAFESTVQIDFENQAWWREKGFLKFQLSPQFRSEAKPGKLNGRILP